MNSRNIVYRGSLPVVEHRATDGSRHRFENGKPKSVKESIAKLLVDNLQYFDAEEAAKPLSLQFPNPGLICVRRWGALGDLIQFRAACAAYKRLRPDHRLILRCTDQFAPIFASDDLWEGISALGTSSQPPATDGYATFDQTAEVDHQGVQVHRVDLFAQAMAHVPVTIEPHDWIFRIPELAEDFVDKWLQNRGLTKATRGCKLIAIQVRGSGPMKTIPIEQLKQIVARITAGGVPGVGNAQVVLIEHDEKQTFKAEGVHTMTGRDALHAIHLLRQCDGLICMDSGALWLGHVAPVRTVCVMGPTRPEQRITKHPYYPLGCQAIKLNDVITVKDKQGCPACFEQATACDGKFACIRSQPDSIMVEAVLQKLADVLEGRLRAGRVL